MASHHSDSLPQPGYSSPNSNVFFNKSSLDSTRKRKPVLQYPAQNVIQEHNVLDLPYYSHQWKHNQFQQQEQHPEQQHHQSSAPSTHNESIMHSSSDLMDAPSWDHDSPDNSFLVMHQQQATFNAADSQPLQFPNYEQESTSLIHGGRHDMGHDGGVGENNSRSLSEIHQMLSLDEFQSEAPCTSSVSSFSFENKDMPRSNTLHSTDLGAGNLLEQRQLLQSWSDGGTTNAQNSYSNNGSTTPGFFTPGFLESLQEDDNESYHTPEFPFHQSNTAREDWTQAPPSRKFTPVEHDMIMVNNRCHLLLYI